MSCIMFLKLVIYMEIQVMTKSEDLQFWQEKHWVEEHGHQFCTRVGEGNFLGYESYICN